jgi:hypothetical protein
LGLATGPLFYNSHGQWHASASLACQLVGVLLGQPQSMPAHHHPCKQFGAILQSVGPNPHIPYVHAKHVIDQSQVYLLKASDKIPSKV